LIDDFKIFDLFLENLAVIVVPFCDFNIKEVIPEVLDVLEVLFEDTLKLN